MRHANNDGIIPVLARRVREVEAKVTAGKRLGPTNRTKFQVIATLMREERARAKTDTALGDAGRAEQLKRLDGIATILAKIAARDTSLIALLENTSVSSETAQRMRRDWLVESGTELSPDDLIISTSAPRIAGETVLSPELAGRQVIPPSVRSRALSNPFLPPDFAAVEAVHPRRRLDSWELLGPLYKAFERGSGGERASMTLPPAPRIDRFSPRGSRLMNHQLRLIQSVREGHRTFLLADEPGLGKTAQALLAASVAGAYPMLAVVPNVVKMNWAREVEKWTPQRRVAVVHGDGADVDAFADIVVINYEILDRHLEWLSRLGFGGMVVDEAHFIKNLHSQRSQYVLGLADSIRKRAHGHEPLLMALTGTPLINDIDDFRATWQFLGWLDGDRPAPRLLDRLEETGLTPADPAFYAEARTAVIDLGMVRRRKIDVAADLPGRRVVDLPVELDGEAGRSIAQAERNLAQRLVERYRAAAASLGALGAERRERLIRTVAQAELEDSNARGDGQNVFAMVRKIGQAKAHLAADYAIQLARSVGKVVFFAKHIDVMNEAERAFADAGLRSISVRGEQSARTRQAGIDAFANDPAVSLAVCSLTAAGVGLNLQAASNVVLAELSWTAAEQTQAIDRVHRIGQAEPVTAWRIVAAQTIDAKIAELIDQKQSLAARALDGSDVTVGSGDSVQLDALVGVLRQALHLG
ncbi:MAG TPA: DEAD/DEAH box helicase [Microbacteriaceae bacterium]|nr:DEAD/DEAH box helicase [Microbacteriaceae bacterium]